MNVGLERIWRERAVKNHLDLIVLRLLKDKPRWGYEINMAVRDMFGVYLSAGTLYPLLHSLEEEGYVEGLWETEKGKGRGRRIYRITERGRGFLTVGERTLKGITRRLSLGEH
ncbi:MAG: PadR family transcriptional regulator [Candidatus Bathyarchaeia archaeon]